MICFKAKKLKTLSRQLLELSFLFKKHVCPINVNKYNLLLFSINIIIGTKI